GAGAGVGGGAAAAAPRSTGASSGKWYFAARARMAGPSSASSRSRRSQRASSSARTPIAAGARRSRPLTETILNRSRRARRAASRGAGRRGRHPEERVAAPGEEGGPEGAQPGVGPEEEGLHRRPQAGGDHPRQLQVEALLGRVRAREGEVLGVGADAQGAGRSGRAERESEEDQPGDREGDARGHG